ncbi:hypothetical protein KU306_09015 [Haloferax larsenii]|uniref:Sulfatase n=1 Tax=Haloferax larsenii TaxID=302484 RepID=A0ABY5R9R9_HALLR|nr:hypothetical protein [Haloferax larsenii]UVE49076.1 hypothetical protein KU306_09015 [Haloferax larsenii]
MYSAAQVARGLRRPRLIAEEVNRLYNSRFGSKSYNDDGVDFITEEWDTLVLLDACRADVLRECNPFDAEVGTRTSRGSQTIEFLRGTFEDKDLLDTVYVTANPQLYRLNNGVYDRGEVDVTFYAQIDVWKDNWDDEVRTVRPECVTDAAIEAHETYPDKRIIVHYIQPHAPFLGPTAQKHFRGDSLAFDWETREGASDEIVRQAYRETLEVTLPEVERLAGSIDGKVVISSDHGQAMGERGFPVPIKTYGHPPSNYIPALVEVPWVELPYERRRDIVAGTRSHVEQDPVEHDIVQERLVDLGYR